MRRNTLAIALAVMCALVPGTVVAQAITGQVLSRDDRAPLPGVNVVIPALQRGTVTNEDGRFVLAPLEPGTYTLTFSYVGFRTVTRTLDLGTDNVRLTVLLQPDVIEGEEVVVTSERDAQDELTYSQRSVSVLEAEALNRARGQTLGETLEDLPGVTTMETGPAISKPVVRGLHSQRVLVLNNGVPQEGQQWGGEHAPEIDPFSPARIEVVRGAAGVEYGIGAIGGVIRVEPRELPEAPGLNGLAMLNAYSNNRQGAGSLLIEGGSRAVPGLGARVQASYRRAGDAHTPDYVIRNSAFEERDLSVALGYHAGPLGFEADFSHFGTDLGIYKGAHIGNLEDLLAAIERGAPAVEYDFSFDIEPPRQTIRHNLLAFKSHYRFPAGDRLEVHYGFQQNHRQEFDAHSRSGDPGREPAFDLTLETHTLDAKLKHRPVGQVFGTVGLSVMNQANVNNEVGYLIPNFRAVTGGVFAHETWVRGGWTIDAGLRYDYRWLRAYPRENGQRGGFVARTHRYQSVTGVLGLIWQFAPTWSVGMNLGSAWRPPGVNELYNFGVHHGTAQFEVGNPELTTERSRNVDATLRHIGARSRLEVSLFHNRMQGFIFLFPEAEPKVTIRGVFPAFRYAQADAVLRGVDGAFSYTLAPFLDVGLSASLLRGDNLDTGEPLIYMPADRLGLRTTWRLLRWRVLPASELEATARLVRRQTRYPEGADFAPPPDGYALFGLGYRTEWKVGAVPIAFSLEIENLLNTTYRDYLSRFRYFIDDPGRNVIVRVQVPIGE